MSAIHLVVPNDIDDPSTPSGGNTYDRRICRGLAASGRSVREHAVRGAWPTPDRAELADLAGVLAAIADGAVVLVDGLVAAAAAAVLVPEARRLRLVVVVHMPVGDGTPELRCSERETLTAAAAVVVTSEWTRRRLLDRYGLAADRVHVATPGVDPAAVVPGSGTGSALLCVAAVTPQKGHDLLTEALARIAELPWSCVCVGALNRDPAFVDRLRRQTASDGLTDRIRFTGPRTGAALAAAYAAADLLVLASRGETYGMVVTEALARGIPVLATRANGLPEALGRAPDGTLPGMLVEPGDPVALADALRRWLGEPELRRQLRRGARGRRATLSGWAVTSELVAGVVDRVSVACGGPA
jgi:glycosyltransferase involved in cell wall biosynthesis